METGRVDLGSLPWQSPVRGSRYKAFQQGNRRLRLVEFTTEFVEPDWCTKGHIGFVLDGEMQVDFDGRTVRLCAGDGIFIPGGDEHRHMARVSAGRVRLILVEEV